MPPNRHQGQEGIDPAPLGTPLHFAFSGKTAPNRFLKAAMTERLSSWDPADPERRGVPSADLINVYRRWGDGGYGLILTGNVMIATDQLEAAGNAIIPRDAPFEGSRFERFRALATAAKAHGSMVAMQLSHPGRQVDSQIQPYPISASDVKLEGEVLGLTFARPRAMERADFDGVVDGFAHAAEYAHKCGYDGVQLHAAHGYLLAQFLSPTTNRRTDQYGGSITNRGRLVMEIASEIRRRVANPSFSLGIKLNSVEFQEAGLTPGECGELCAELERARFDYVELSGGTYQSLAFEHRRESTRRREAYFLEFADMIVPRLRNTTKAYVTGGFRTASAMVEALRTVHGVGLARPAASEFDLPKKILHDGVSGAIRSPDDDDFGTTLLAAGTQ